MIESRISGGCTIPGCYYPQIFSHHVNSSVVKSLRVRGGKLSCQHVDEGTPVNRIECRLKCKKGWENANNVDLTVCTKGQVEALVKVKNLTSHTISGSLRKTTNFTTDYLECRRKIVSNQSYNLETTSLPRSSHFETTILVTAKGSYQKVTRMTSSNDKNETRNEVKINSQQQTLPKIEMIDTSENFPASTINVY